MKVLSLKSRLFDDIGQRRHSDRSHLQWCFTTCQTARLSQRDLRCGRSGLRRIFQVNHVSRRIAHGRTHVLILRAQLFETSYFYRVAINVNAAPAQLAEQYRV